MGTNNIDNEDEELFVTITLEDDSEIECEVLTIFEVEEQGAEGVPGEGLGRRREAVRHPDAFPITTIYDF